MQKNIYIEKCETIIAQKINPVIQDMKLVDAGDYIAYIHSESHANICDIVDSSTELYFQPHTLSFAMNGDYRLEWADQPAIFLDMEFCSQDITALFRITMTAETFHVKLNSLECSNGAADPETGTQRLIDAFDNAAITHP